MKLINYRCPNCGNEKEYLVDKVGKATKVICEKCNVVMKEFNFKNNKQRVFIQDPQK